LVYTNTDVFYMAFIFNAYWFDEMLNAVTQYLYNTKALFKPYIYLSKYFDTLNCLFC